MYEISVRLNFDAAHALRGYQGKCENIHGHRFEVVANLRAKEINDIGITYDFTELKQQLKTILNKLDHVCLNETPPFDQINPSAENIAAWVYKELEAQLQDRGISLSSIQVWESPDCCVTYFP
jgi:6-pyruvoyltetrahydropterin/6-carboxytetrahydropterin synthase